MDKRKVIGDVAGLAGDVLVGAVTGILIKKFAFGPTIFEKVVASAGGAIIGNMVGDKVDEYIHKEVDEIFDTVDQIKDFKKDVVIEEED